MKKLLPYLIAGFLITACAPNVPQEQYDTALTDLEDLRTNISSLETEIQRLENVESNLVTREEELEAALSELETLRSNYDDLEDERAELNRKTSILESTISEYRCDEGVSSMSYSNILDSSSKLQAWVTNQPWASRSTSTIRDSIWNNTDTKLHGIYYVASKDNERYLTWFLVYYDEFGWDKGTFWLDGQCWLEKK